jgi:hypothetical protein
MRLKSLNCPFLSSSDISKLQKANVDSTIQLIAHGDIETLSQQTSIPVNTLNMVKKFIIGQFAPIPEQCNVLVERYLKKFFIIEIGSQNLNEMVSGGIYSSEITEITGASATGKTQLCLNLIVNMFKLNPTYTTIYIDSNKNFCLQRLIDVFHTKFPSENQGGTQSTQTSPVMHKFLKSIKIFDCLNAFHLLDILYRIKKSSSISNTQSSGFTKDQDIIPSPNLLIIDSLTSLFSLFRIKSSESDYYLSCVVQIVRYLAVNMNIALVVITNANSCEASYNSLNSLINDNEKWARVPSLHILLESSNISAEKRDVINEDLDLDQMSLSSKDGADKTISKGESISRKLKILRCNRPVLNCQRRESSFSITSSGIQ